jgi:multiple sugar transport system substrate-binding protein
MKTKTTYFVLAVLVILSMLIGACAAPAAAPAAEAPAAEAPAEAAAPAGEFNWRAHEGESLKLLLNQHPYQQALVGELPKFTELTGIEVTYDVFPEQNYFDKVTIDLQAGDASTYDVFMTGAYMIWQYAPAGWMEPLEGYINDPSKTNADYDFEDILPGLRNSEMWTGEAGAASMGAGSQWALPWGWESNAYMYRKDIFDANGLTPPTNIDELVAVSKKLKEINPEMAGIVVRGSLNWATIHPGFMTMYASQGCVDYDENMVPQMNSPCAVEVTEKWIDMVKSSGPEAWTTYTWYQAGADFQSGLAATMFDADILGFFGNQENAAAPEVLGNIAWAPGPRGPEGQLNTNVWIWSLAMNAGSKKKDAAWLFMQWATGKDFLTTAVVEPQYTMVNPVRQSVIDNPAFQERMEFHTDYMSTLKTISEGDMRIHFTPSPIFFETTTEWAQALQDIYAGADAQTRLDALVKSLTEQLQDVGILE